MKKLYYLDESEKERILNLHNKHKGNLLNEQTNENAGSWTSDAKTDWSVNVEKNFSTSRSSYQTSLIKFCKGKDDKNNDNYEKYFPNGPSFTEDVLDGITDKIGLAMQSGAQSGILGGRGVSTEAVKKMSAALLTFQNMANFCFSIKNQFSRNSVYGDENVAETFDEIYQNAGEFGYKKAFVDVLTKLAKQTKVIGADQSTQNATQSKEGTTNLEACLKANAEAKKLNKLQDGNWYYFVYQGRITYYDKDGDYYSVDENTYLNRDPKTKDTYHKFTCDASNKIIPTKDTSTTTQQTNTGGSGTSGQKIAGGYVLPNAFTPEKVSTIKQAIGSTDKSGTLTQDDINKLYAKLSQ